MIPSAEPADAANRRRLGQYWTPPRVARWMADWVVQPTTRSVLDPAVGAGALLVPLLDHPGLAPEATLTGIDVDPVVLATAHAQLAGGRRPLRLAAGDFLRLDDSTRYDAIVCNPPYVRHRALLDRAELYARIDRDLGIRLNRFSNTYGLFMLRIAQRLSAGGRAAILAPVDWLNANFGTPIKAYLLRENLLDGVVVFGKRTLVFSDANVAACIVLLRAGRAAAEPICFAAVAAEADLVPLALLPPERRATVDPAELRAPEKWLPRVPQPASAPAAIVRERMVPLGELAAVRRGIATGANEFFTLSAAEREHHGLVAETRPCVVKAPHAPFLQFTPADFETLRASETKAFVLDLRGAVSAAADAYIGQGVAQGIDRRYLPRMRRPWYATESRGPAPLWVTTFSRRGFRCVVNAAGVAQLTAFHGIFPRSDDPDWPSIIAAWLNSGPGLRLLDAQQRSYGSGLSKLEPSDVAAVPVPLPERLPATVRAEIVALWTARCAAERSGVGGAAAAELDRLWERLG